MQPMRFKKALFGFSREQVIDYIAQMDRLAEQKRQELIRDYEDKLSQAEMQLELAQQQSEQHLAEARQASERADGLQQQVASLSQQVEAGQLLRQRLEETAAEREEWIDKYAALEKEMDRVSREAMERERKLSEFIDRVQEKNVELLQKQVAMEVRVANAEREMSFWQRSRQRAGSAACSPVRPDREGRNYRGPRCDPHQAGRHRRAGGRGAEGGAALPPGRPKLTRQETAGWDERRPSGDVHARFHSARDRDCSNGKTPGFPASSLEK